MRLSAHTAREISRTEGLFVGYTSGAVMQAVKQLQEQGEFKKDSQVVVIFPDHGSRYMSKIYSDQWHARPGFFRQQECGGQATGRICEVGKLL